MSPGDRAEAMALRVARTAARLGLDASGRAAVDRALRHALAQRAQLDARHPDRLHPARVVLILTDDAGVRDPVVLAAAALLDTRAAALPPPARYPTWLPPEVPRLVAQVPRPREPDEVGGAEGEEDVAPAEALLTASEPARLIALAAWLDHARHLHFRDSREWRSFHELTCRVYAPIAARTNPTLERRFNAWCRAFQRRFEAS